MSKVSYGNGSESRFAREGKVLESGVRYVDEDSIQSLSIKLREGGGCSSSQMCSSSGWYRYGREIDRVLAYIFKSWLPSSSK